MELVRIWGRAVWCWRSCLLLAWKGLALAWHWKPPRRLDRLLNGAIALAFVVDFVLCLGLVASLPRIVADVNKGKPSAIEQRLLDREDEHNRQRQKWRR